MSFFLLKSLESVLQTGFAGFVFRQDNTLPEVHVEPTFYIGMLPPRRKEGDPAYVDNGYFPFIVNRFTKGTDSLNESLIGVSTICGIYTAEGVEGGENDIANMLFVAKRLILQKRCLDAFALEGDLKWYMGSDIGEDNHIQAHPHYVCKIDTMWRAAAIFEEILPQDQLNIFSNGY